MKLISAKVLTSCLHIDQTGSTLDYARALALLTERCPEVWTQYYSGSGKKSAVNRLQQFLRKGSQSAPPDFWVQVGLLMRSIPEKLYQAEEGEKSPGVAVNDGTLKPFPLLDAVLLGLHSKAEPRTNLAQAWITYLQVFERVQMLQRDDDLRRQYCTTYVLPIISNFVGSSQEALKWSVAAPQHIKQSICVRAFLLVWEGAQDALSDFWEGLSAKIVEHIKTSLPEQSKEHESSQKSVSDETSKWYGLEGAIMKESDSQSVSSLFQITSSSELKTAIQSLTSRNGKPFGAAATLLAALELAPELVFGNSDLKAMLYDFVVDNISPLLLSPSAPYIVAILDRLHGRMDIFSVYQAGLRSLKAEQNSPAKSRALASILSSPVLDKIGINEMLQDLTVQLLEDAIRGYDDNWNLVETTIRNPAAPVDVVDGILSTMFNGLAVDETIRKSLHGLETAVKSNSDALLTFANTTEGSKLLSRLLFLAESPDADVANQAVSISNAVQGVMSGEKGPSQFKSSLLDVVSQGLDTPTAASLP